MKTNVMAILALAAGLVGEAHAQIGCDRRECDARWGVPVSGQVDTNGAGTLAFASGGLAAEFSFVAGTAQRAVYRAATFDEDVINGILNMNSGGLEWHGLRLPGRQPAENETRQWMRSDEMAMAELTADGLTVLGAEWNRHLADPVQAAGTNAPPGDSMANPEETSLKPVGRDDIVGFWLGAEAEGLTVALHAVEGGALNWVVHGETERQVIKAHWTREPSVQNAYTFAEVPAAGVAPRIIGRGRLESPDQLHIQAGQNALDPHASSPWQLSADLCLERVASMPRWKAKGPGNLPTVGDTMEDAVRLLGQPRGTMMSGGRQVLMYNWGNVWIARGVVTRVE